MRIPGIKRTIMALAMLAMALPSVVIAQETSEEVIEITKSDQDISVEVNDGKVVIRKNGKVVKTLDLSNLDGESDAKGTRQLVKIREVQDGAPLVTRAEAILIGPDGPHKTVLERNYDEVVSLFVEAENDSPAFAIGVSCSSLPEALSAQLKLKNGLVVDRVFEDSAAHSAGVSQHDIILKIDGIDVAGTQQLVEAIQQAGKAQKPVALKIVRVGKVILVDVKPVKRETSGTASRKVAQLILDRKNAPALRGNLTTKLMRNIDGGSAIELRQVLPGMIQEKIDVVGESSQGLAKEIAELRNQIEQLRQEIRNK